MCVSKIAIKYVDAFGREGFHLVPCGRCPECLAQKQMDWQLRCEEESRNYNYVWFFTNTYANENLYYNEVPLFDEETGEVEGSEFYTTVHKEDLQLWFKRFRTNIKRKYGSRYEQAFWNSLQ